MTLELFDRNFKSIATFGLADSSTDAILSDGAIVSFTRSSTELSLRMHVGIYQYKVNAPPKTDTFKVDGSNGHIQL